MSCKAKFNNLIESVSGSLGSLSFYNDNNIQKVIIRRDKTHLVNVERFGFFSMLWKFCSFRIKNYYKTFLLNNNSSNSFNKAVSDSFNYVLSTSFFDNKILIDYFFNEKFFNSFFEEKLNNSFILLLLLADNNFLNFQELPVSCSFSHTIKNPEPIFSKNKFLKGFKFFAPGPENFSAFYAVNFYSSSFDKPETVFFDVWNDGFLGFVESSEFNSDLSFSALCFIKNDKNEISFHQYFTSSSNQFSNYFTNLVDFESQ